MVVPTTVRMVSMLMSGALLGKALGLIRQILMARVFGVSTVADSFRASVVATNIPLAPLQNEGVPAVMVPMCARWEQEGCAPQRLAALAIAMTLMGFAVTLPIFFLAPWWVKVLVGGFSEEAQSTTVDFVRIMALSMPPSVLLNCLAAGEIAVGRSRIASLRAPILNVWLIIAIALYALTGSALPLPWCFSGAFIGLAVWSTYVMRHEGLLDFKGMRWRPIHETGAEFLQRTKPLLLHPVAELIQTFIERRVASDLFGGAVAALDYARTLTDTAILIVSQPLGMGVLHQRIGTGDNLDVMSKIARPLLAISIPCSIFLVVFASDIVWIVFGGFAFDARAQSLTSDMVRGIGMGLWAAILGWVLIRILNNRGQNGRAMLILAVGFACNGLANFATPLFASSGQGMLVLGLGESLRSLVLLFGTAFAIGFHRTLIGILVRCLPMASIMLAACLAAAHYFPSMPIRLGAGMLALAICVLPALSTFRSDRT